MASANQIARQALEFRQAEMHRKLTDVSFIFTWSVELETLQYSALNSILTIFVLFSAQIPEHD